MNLRHQFSQIFPKMLLPLAVLLTMMGTGFTQNTMVIRGTVIDSMSEKSLPDAHIQLLRTYRTATSNEQGQFVMKVPRRGRQLLTISYIGYETRQVPIPYPEAGQDTVDLRVVMKQRTNVLGGVEVLANAAPDTVYGSNRFSISDYEFLEDGFLFLVYPKRLEKSSFVITTDRNEKILNTAEVPGKAQKLFEAYQGSHFVVTRDWAYEVQPQEDELFLLPIDKGEFQSTIQPGLDTVNNQIIFSDYRWYYPLFHYYAYNPESGDPLPFKQVIDPELYRKHRFEYYFLSPREKLQARQIAMELGEDKHDVAAFMSGFADDIRYEPLYAPLFVWDDTLLVFDYASNHLYHYNQQVECMDSVAIDYHLHCGRYKWAAKMYIDETEGTCFASYTKEGFTYLRPIGRSSGSAGDYLKLAHRYPEKIKIKGGYVYYIHRPQQSLQKKFLYREPLPF